MKRAFVHYKLAIAAALLGAAGGGFWLTHHAKAGTSSGKTAPTATAALGELPVTGGTTTTDREISRWAEQARQTPKDDRNWANLGDALMQKARETADVTYYGHAERAYRQALEINAKSVEATVGLAWVNGGRHEFEQSIAWANKALALDPQNNEALGLIGDANVEMGDYDAAFANYQKMLDSRPDLASYGRGAHLLWLTGDMRKAVWLMVKAINTGAPFAENTAWCRAQLALMFFSDGNMVAAENTLQAALEKTPNNYQVLAAMGRVQAARGRYDAAIRYYEKAVAVVPQHDALVALGDLYTLTGKPQEAAKRYALVESIHALQKANGVRGDMQMARFDADHDRHLPEALKEAQAEYATRKNVYAADTLAWCLYKNGRFAEAREMIQQALSKKTPEAAFHFHAGMIYAKLGDRASAQLALYRAMNLNPHFSPLDASRCAKTLKQLASAISPGPRVVAVNTESK